MNTYFRLTHDTIVVSGHTLHRIQALKDIPDQGVSQGDKGGFMNYLTPKG